MNAFAALADPTRMQIVEMLAAGERTAGDIAAQFAMSGPAISQHLKVLREAGLITVRAEAQRRIYALDPRGFGALDDWLQHIRRFWGGRLDELERQLRATPGTEGQES
ncbi:DNA-binding transcriptional ArsR family regulator [Inquilinus ginsengisoli]|uniref:DNA-binding transcriptional ArsR family regulator n=1 Tax=Inquilinus ginsengisoli TaxID=363840 RepID=A0ABU1JV92_9PROT|nr:metalloregulator ArsR/SmtB family transcription factor [Inquilinus ginsengisoli]MDR6291929.1 DNA-binding transcriptional ArsR family regulator [Inquilinus ginsengisoli]